MKLKNLFWFATGASISYHLVKNRKEIKTEVTESSQLVTDFQYKTKLFSQQATASLKEIQDIWQPNKND